MFIAYKSSLWHWDFPSLEYTLIKVPNFKVTRFVNLFFYFLFFKMCVCVLFNTYFPTLKSYFISFIFILHFNLKLLISHLQYFSI